jgi:hypothetical protein
MFSGPQDKWVVVKDSYGDPRVGVDVSSIRRRGDLALAIIRDRHGNEGYFATDCEVFLAMIHPSSMTDLAVQIEDLPRIFARDREHIHPDSVGARTVAAICAAH